MKKRSSVSTYCQAGKKVCTQCLGNVPIRREFCECGFQFKMNNRANNQPTQRRPFVEEVMDMDGNVLNAHEASLPQLEYIPLADDNGSLPEPLPPAQRVDLSSKIVFHQHWLKFQESHGGTVDKMPTLGKTEIDLHKLYSVVTQNGGLERVILEKKLQQVSRSVPELGASTNPQLALRVMYLRYLASFERKFFWGVDSPAVREIQTGPQTRSEAHHKQQAAAQQIQHHSHGTNTDYNLTELPQPHKRQKLSHKDLEDHLLLRISSSLLSTHKVDVHWAINSFNLISSDPKITIILPKFQVLLSAISRHFSRYLELARRSTEPSPQAFRSIGVAPEYASVLGHGDGSGYFFDFQPIQDPQDEESFFVRECTLRLLFSLSNITATPINLQTLAQNSHSLLDQILDFLSTDSFCPLVASQALVLLSTFAEKVEIRRADFRPEQTTPIRTSTATSVGAPAFPARWTAAVGVITAICCDESAATSLTQAALETISKLSRQDANVDFLTDTLPACLYPRIVNLLHSQFHSVALLTIHALSHYPHAIKLQLAEHPHLLSSLVPLLFRPDSQRQAAATLMNLSLEDSILESLCLRFSRQITEAMVHEPKVAAILAELPVRSRDFPWSGLQIDAEPAALPS
eukprot:TRINITY_DN2846_c0_g1_i3.p1 TRINITY_DN2846_c0_g1~~TRINITY_DN2846_c0_g1_i3.p1  ORF type:complete len:632 (-),score=129.88 TRINITY_DN2846_c0_g1_i3:46-1941(-)